MRPSAVLASGPGWKLLSIQKEGRRTEGRNLSQPLPKRGSPPAGHQAAGQGPTPLSWEGSRGDHPRTQRGGHEAYPASPLNPPRDPGRVALANPFSRGSRGWWLAQALPNSVPPSHGPFQHRPSSSHPSPVRNSSPDVIHSPSGSLHEPHGGPSGPGSLKRPSSPLELEHFLFQNAELAISPFSP